MPAKPRILTDHKDMVWSLIPLLGICLLIALVSGNCSVGLTGGASDDKTPAYDVRGGLTADAQSMAFPIRLPQTPQGWKPNSGSRAGIDGRTVSTVGYITTDGVYMQLSQTDATEDGLVDYLDDDQPLGKGTIDSAGQQWVRYAAADDKTIWVADLGDVRIGLYSKASEKDFTTLAQAVVTGKVLPRRSLPQPVG
ncbi:DUF4245 domain-containing protein [Williamsia deligens]|uniref:DUF4245 domain-containing protein n=1 Tax=Williamsia deligens TaxID=321325 RepID=A0ABW3G972_9NOCA|nr:DUF4245 domain-containing protein [Williamsia deligens]MCP2192401.1 Protein of unknown function (DUF4245) [Williamsia deligens]